jgi:alpha-tubulin suppressor-like RCC1 family protein
MWALVCLASATVACGDDGRPGGSATPGPARVVVAGRHLCVTRGGRLWCWGSDEYGQTGQGAPARLARARPLEVPGVAAVIETAVSDDHTCARLASGRVKCWGQNGVNQTAAVSAPSGTCLISASDGGGGNAPCQPTPTEVPAVHDAVQLSLGDGRSCALLATGRVTCWGQEGRGSDWLVAVPEAQSIAIGNQSGCIVKRDAALACANPQPWTIQMWTGVQRVVMAVGSQLACVLHIDGRVACWGSNAAGERGIGHNDINIPLPEDPPAIAQGAVDVGVGVAHVCALMRGGEVLCWGRNTYGSLGFPVAAASRACSAGPCQLTPRKVEGLPPAAQLAAGGYNTCTISDSNELRCWGEIMGHENAGLPTYVAGPWEDP